MWGQEVQSSHAGLRHEGQATSPSQDLSALEIPPCMLLPVQLAQFCFPLGAGGPHSAHCMSSCPASQGDTRRMMQHPFGLGPLLQLCLPSYRGCSVWCLSQAVNSSDTHFAAKEPKPYRHRGHTYQELPPFHAASSGTPCASGRDKQVTTATLLL